MDRHRGRASPDRPLLRLHPERARLSQLAATASRTFEDRYFPAVADSRTGAQIGQFGWGLDYLTPANFIQPTLTCESFVPANPERTNNVGGFCDPQLDAEIDAALAQADADPATANAAWAAIDRKLVDAAATVPLFDRRSVTVVSERVQNVQLHPFWGVLMDQLWVQ